MFKFNEESVYIFSSHIYIYIYLITWDYYLRVELILYEITTYISKGKILPPLKLRKEIKLLQYIVETQIYDLFSLVVPSNILMT